MRNRQQMAQVIAWSVTGTAILLAIIAWGQGLSWHIFGTTTYLLFPIFGLIAFSTLWSQYIALATMHYFKLDSAVLRTYFKVTGWMVLVAILLHPGLLIWQLWRDGRGLPPGSDLHYVLPGLKGFVILGMINLTILLLFELRRIYAKKKWWRPFTYIVDLVMISIFIHGLKLGTQTHMGWYRKVWFIYGTTLVLALLYIYRMRFLKRQSKLL